MEDMRGASEYEADEWAETEELKLTFKEWANVFGMCEVN